MQRKKGEGVRDVMVVDVGQNNCSAQISRFGENSMRVLSTSCKGVGVGVIDEEIARHLGQEFEKKHKVNLFSAPNAHKAINRLRKEAIHIKEMLSTLQATPVSLEVLYDGKDLLTNVSRNLLEDLASKTLLPSISHVILQVVEKAKQVLLERGEGELKLESVEVVGGGVRVPAVKQTIQKTSGKELGYTLDEQCVAYGSALLGAILSGDDFNQNSTYKVEGDPMETFQVPSQWRLPEEKINEATQLEVEMLARDQLERSRENKKNELENFIFETRNNVEGGTGGGELSSLINEAQKKELLELLNEVEQWCAENSEESLHAFTEKLNNTKQNCRQIATPFFEKMDQMEEERKRREIETSQESKSGANVSQKEKKLKPADKLKLAEEKKAQGNQHFANLDYQAAISRYVQVLALCNELYDLSDELKKKSEELKLSAYLNLALCNYKLKAFSRLNSTNISFQNNISPFPLFFLGAFRIAQTQLELTLATQRHGSEEVWPTLEKRTTSWQ